MNVEGYTPKVIGISEGPQPEWPNNRDKETIYTLHEFNDEDTLQWCPNIARLTDLMPQHAKVVDLGCGRGRLAKELKQERDDITYIGVSAHDIDPANLEVMDRAYLGKIPENLELLKDYKGRIDLVVDTYGPMSFADNPVHVLIYAVLLLNGTGTFTSITSESGKERTQSVLGTPETWKKIKDFFKEFFLVDVAIIPTKIKSQVFQSRIIKDYIVRCRRTSTAPLYTSNDYAKLCQLADQKIGIPLQEDAWYAPTKDFAIRQKKWVPLSNEALEAL